MISLSHDIEQIRFHQLLGPYLGSRAVTDDQVNSALASGLTTDEIHDRLLDAECTIVSTCDPQAWQTGWMTAADDIERLAGQEESSIPDLRDQAFDEWKTLRRRCYATALETGTPELDAVVFSSTVGRHDCCRTALIFAPDAYPDSYFATLAAQLRSNPSQQYDKAIDLRHRRREADEIRAAHALEEAHLNDLDEIESLKRALMMLGGGQ